VIPVCAGIILRSGMILLARRGPGRSNAGQWEFPGGRIEPGETPAEALARELREELGIVAQVGAEAARARHGDADGAVDVVALIVSSFQGQPTLSVHDKLAWVEARRLGEYELSAADREIAKVVAAHRRRSRYKGTHPRDLEEKYKELRGDEAAVARAKERGSTPAGTHRPVMIDEVLAALSPLEGTTILDCTLGWGGHTEALAGRAASVIGLDRDGEELAKTVRRLSARGLSLVARHADYASARETLTSLGRTHVDGLLADLGVSSMQLDRPDRGMSFKNDGPLDMRMDRSRGPTAAEWLARSSEKDIAEALATFGDEPDAVAVAARIIALRKAGRTPTTTAALSAAVSEAKKLPPGRRLKRNAFSSHPAARTFQALRIAVNAERESLARLLSDLPMLVHAGGRVALLTFHSGEERLVADILQSQTGAWEGPLAAPQRPRPEEVRDNPRARSAKLWRAVRAGAATGDR
jgi:16S rRNA (cytosine1402-N4)-methyltransferase